MKPRCPHLNCPSRHAPGPKIDPIVRKGFYFRKSDSKKIRRFLCKLCLTQFSHSTDNLKRYQKKRRLNSILLKLLVSGVSQRRAALLLSVNRKTVARRFQFLAQTARLKNEAYLKKFQASPLAVIQFDDLETSEHTKCKPLSVALAVEPNYRKILQFQVSQMPAKGHLSKLSYRKYGFRRDERGLGWQSLLQNLKPVVQEKISFHSDENPHYPKWIKREFPKSTHLTVPGGRGAITGQGELKKKKFDPIFSLNHSCAMLRANINRLFRRTWCTTKKRERLRDHLDLYIQFHNHVLTPPYPFLGTS